MVKKIIKRDGRKKVFDPNKIEEAIYKAQLACGDDDRSLCKLITNKVIETVNEKYDNFVSVENVQNIIENVLIDMGEAEIAKTFIRYRAERTKVRERKTNLMKSLHDITFKDSKDEDSKRENANINADTPMGMMLKYGSESAKQFYLNDLIKPEYAQAHIKGDIHIHDLDFYALTMTCCQIDLIELFKNGFSTGNGFLREPNGIRSYSSLACIAIQANQNDQHGGQSVPNFDYAMALGVRKTYKKELRKSLENMLTYAGFEVTQNELKVLFNEIEEQIKCEIRMNDAKTNEFICKTLNEKFGSISEKALNAAFKFAYEGTYEATYQAMEALVHNLNTMHSRAGAQVPFSSLNYGTDTSDEGRMVMHCLLDATMAGLGNGETPIFPIQIFKVKEGVNYNPEDINYDLFKKSMLCSSKRLFPNFSFLDAPYNKQYYKEGDYRTEIAYMGCRTRVIGNTYDPSNEIVTGRGNLSFTSINLPRIALKLANIKDQTKKFDKFYKELDNLIDLCANQLLERFEIQQNKFVYNFPFLMGQGVWFGSDKLKNEDKISEILKHGTLTIGFIGLAETLKCLIGQHHGESEEAQKIGLEIVQYMRNKIDQYAKRYKLNFSLIATPAEGLSGRFVKMDKALFGEIEGVTNHKFYTNSFHVPVYHNISVFEKIKKEAPYHALTNGGHISYIEVDGDIAKNLDAFESIVRAMKEEGIGYGAVNHPIDRDPICGYNGIIDNTCPKCGREEGDVKFERIRRITGYLVGTLDRFNDAKRDEVNNRVKHMKAQNEN